MPRQDVEFKTQDHVTLRGWLYTPSTAGEALKKLPCLVMSHGWTALKEMALDEFAEAFTSKLPIACLVFDNRGFGASDTALNQPRFEIIPSLQTSDISDAITYAQSREEIDASKIGIWGSSYSGGHSLYVAGCDKRVKACISQVPLVNGWENFHRLIRADIVLGLNAMFEGDRLARAAGKAPAMIPVVSNEPLTPSSLPSADSYEFFIPWEAKGVWKNEVTVRSIELFRAYDPSCHITHVAPTPLLMCVAENDGVTPTDLALRAYAQALEPKQLVMLPGGHFDAYSGTTFTYNVGKQVEFLQRTLCR